MRTCNNLSISWRSKLGLLAFTSESLHSKRSLLRMMLWIILTLTMRHQRWYSSPMLPQVMARWSIVFFLKKKVLVLTQSLLRVKMMLRLRQKKKVKMTNPKLKMMIFSKLLSTFLSLKSFVIRACGSRLYQDSDHLWLFHLYTSLAFLMKLSSQLLLITLM